MALAKGVVDELVCAICLEVFNWPVTLPCAHTFCKQCLINVHQRSRIRRSIRRTNSNASNAAGISVATNNSSNDTNNNNTTNNPQLSGTSGTNNDGPPRSQSNNSLAGSTHGDKLVCPHCRAEFKLGEAGINALPRNTILTNIILSLEEEKKTKAAKVTCEVCEDDPPRLASKICTDCCVTYCVGCFRQLHPMRGSFRFHVIKETNQLTPSMGRRSVSPAVDSRASLSGRCTPLFDGGDGDSGDEGSMTINQDSIERIRRRVKSKRKELGSVMKNVQAMMKYAEDDTEKRTREVREMCSQISQCVGEKESILLTTINKQRQETVRECIALKTDVKGHTDLLDHIEEQLDDVISVTAVYASDDVQALEKRLNNVHTQSLLSKSKSIDRHPSLASNSICEGIRSLDFTRDSANLSTPNITCLDHVPVVKGPARVKIKWESIKGAIQYCLSTTHKDDKGNETTATTSFDPLTTGHCLSLPLTDTNYTIGLVVTSDKGSHPPATKIFRTLPYIHSLRMKFDPAVCHKNIAVSQDRTEMRHRKCQLGAFYNECPVASSPHRLERLEGATAEECMSKTSHIYWEYQINFHIFGRLNTNSLICDIGFCQQGTENQASSLCDNSFGCSAFLVRRRDKVCVEFWNGPNRQCISRSVPVLDLSKSKVETIRLGFFYKGPEQGVSIVNPVSNTILCRFESRLGNVLPVCALYNGGQIYVSIKCLYEEVKLPSVLAKLIEGD